MPAPTGPRSPQEKSFRFLRIGNRMINSDQIIEVVNETKKGEPTLTVTVAHLVKTIKLQGEAVDRFNLWLESQGMYPVD